MDQSQLKENDNIIEWLANYKKANTHRLYLQAMKGYTDFIGKNPTELLDEAENEISEGVKPRKRTLRGYITKYKLHLQDQGLAELTIKARVAAVISYYKCFDIEIPHFPRDSEGATPLKANMPIPSKEDLQNVLSVCDPLETALLTCGVSSGLSSNELKNLTVKDFLNGFDEVTGVTTLDLRRGKTSVDFITFFSAEASAAVKAYLDFRCREVKSGHKHRLEQLEKQRVTSEDNFLFCLRNVPGKYLKNMDDSLRQLSDNAVTKIYRGMSEKASLNTKSGTWNKIRSHNMRKYFFSALVNAGCPHDTAHYMMGHRIGAVNAAYTRYNLEDLKQMYIRYMPSVTVRAETIIDNPDYQNVKNELENLKKQFAEMNATYTKMFENIKPDEETSRALRAINSKRLVLLPEEED